MCAGIIVSTIGDIGITLSRATNAIGRQQRAAYLLQWHALQWIKEEGCTWYDLSGANKVENPGVYSYKAGFCGKNGTEVLMMNQYQMCKGKFRQYILNFIEFCIQNLRRRR